ncbi:hypothetical protein E2562_011023 [Oryza meyeriana var. granulata]|uniref:Uncharacterized protein n=1 Tax=Oryza meyeriana var. granulata TaxID=110450 RepID=A0A6G1EWC3_9ORYZ|nr:hypothetical protein E2562_011023 [Oryza meyeriana var. granulata]
MAAGLPPPHPTTPSWDSSSMAQGATDDNLSPSTPIGSYRAPVAYTCVGGVAVCLRLAAGVVMVVPLDLSITPIPELQETLVGLGGVDDPLVVMLFAMAERLRPSNLWK